MRVMVAWLLMMAACNGGRANQGPGDAAGAPPIDSPAPVDVAVDVADAPPDAAIDAARPDAPPDAAIAMPPRLIAPLSMATATQQRPTLRWALPAGASAPSVELCKDRACATPIATSVQVAADGVSARPGAALPPGWVYWRVHATSNGEETISATWQMWIGRASATTPVDASSGVTLDINGDGFADLVVGAPLGFSSTGEAFVYFGSASAGAATWNGSNAPARIALFPALGGSFGATMASVGDVNGDGFADFVVGGVLAGAGGTAYLYLGSANPSANDWNGDAPARRIVLGNPLSGGHGFGVSVAGAGDLDGDGFADFLVGNVGLAHVFFGSATPSASEWNDVASPRRIDVAHATELNDTFGSVVAGAGDVNGDGFADFVVTAPTRQIDSGAAYVYLGSASPSGTDWNKTTSTTRLELLGPDNIDARFGTTAAAVGDVNNDGFADFVIGAELANAGVDNSESGAAHLYLGAASPSVAGWAAAGATQRVDLVSPGGAGTTFGSAVAGAGDVNGDGFADFVIGSFETQQARGAAHVYLGAASPSTAAWNGASHARRIDLANPDGVGARFGGAAGNAGDVNGDGFADFLVGTFSDAFLSSAGGGAAHVYLGLTAPASLSWNGVAPAKRIDLTSPAGLGTGFGNAVAAAEPRRAARPGGAR